MIKNNLLKSIGNNQQSSSVTTTISYEDKAFFSSSTTERTFSNMSFGATDSNRYVIVICHTVDNQINESDVLSVTIGGVSATKLIDSSDGSGSYGYSECSIWYAQPNGTTGNIVVSFDESCAYHGIGVFRLITDSITPHDSDGYESSSESDVWFNLNVPQGGVVLAGSQAVNQSACTWQSSLVEQYDDDINTGEYMSAAYINNFSGSSPIRIDNDEASCLCAVSWS